MSRTGLRLLFVVFVLAAIGPDAGAATLKVHQDGADLVFEWDGGIDTLERATSPAGPFSPVGAPAMPPLSLSNEAAIVGLDYYYRLASGSNMAFRLEWSFPTSDGPSRPWLISLPRFLGLRDISDSNAPDEPCDFSGGGGGPAAVDGVVNADDAICQFWTDRTEGLGGASFTMQRYDTLACRYEGRTGLRLGVDGEVRIGSWLSPIDRREVLRSGFVVNTNRGAMDEPMQNQTVFVGSHDPTDPGHLVAEAPCRRDIISVPYHTLYQTADELLCGLEQIDWRDENLDGHPDSCHAGIFDPVSEAAVSVARINSDPASPSYGAYEARTVFMAGGRLRFAGTDFSLRAGEAYLVNVTDNYRPRIFLAPHH